jgi:hypothetical protein
MKSVQSFDMWDTLVGRMVNNPHDVFYIMKTEYSMPSNFVNDRINAERNSDGTFDSIYNNLKKQYGTHGV